MDNGEIVGSDEHDFGASSSSQGVGLGVGRKYRPVVAHDTDRAVLEMSSLDPSSFPK